MEGTYNSVSLVVPHLNVVRVKTVEVLVDGSWLVGCPKSVFHVLIEAEGANTLSKAINVCTIGKLGGDLKVLVLKNEVLELGVQEGGRGVEEDLSSISPSDVEAKWLGDEAKTVVGRSFMAGANSWAREHSLGNFPPLGRGVSELDMETIISLKIHLKSEGRDIHTIVLAAEGLKKRRRRKRKREKM